MVVLAILVVAFLALLLRFRPPALQSTLNYITRDEMPIWLSILFAAFAAGGTYFLAPVINQDLEFQKNRSAHVMSTVNDVNSEIVQLTKDVRTFNESLFYEEKNVRSSRGALLDQIAELQWHLIDVGIVIRRAGSDDRCVGEMKTSLDNLRLSAVEAQKPEDQESVIGAYRKTAGSSERCLQVLYGAAKLT